MARLQVYFWRFALAAYWLGLFAGTHWPQSGSGSVVASHDKLVHAGAFLGLTLLVCRVARDGKPGYSKLLLGAGLLGYAVLDELLQVPVPGRVADVADVAADAVGIAGGLALAALVASVRPIPGRVSNR